LLFSLAPRGFSFQVFKAFLVRFHLLEAQSNILLIPARRQSGEYEGIAQTASISKADVLYVNLRYILASSHMLSSKLVMPHEQMKSLSSDAPLLGHL